MELSQVYRSKYLKELRPQRQTAPSQDRARRARNDRGLGREKLVAYFRGKATRARSQQRRTRKPSARSLAPTTDHWVGASIVLVPARVPYQGNLVDTIRVEVQTPALDRREGRGRAATRPRYPGGAGEVAVMSAATSPNRNLRAARWYAERGLAVFPLVPRTKVPQAGSHGELDGTTDAATIDKMWEGRPHLLVAVALRFTPYFVVDADARHCGDEWLRSFPALPHTATCISGSGWPSTHHYFRRTPELEEVRARKLVPPGGFCTGIDLKGLRAGYVVLPPSLHPWGRRYEWESSSRFGEVPIRGFRRRGSFA